MMNCGNLHQTYLVSILKYDMMNKIINTLSNWVDVIEYWWESKSTQRLASNFLVLSFTVGFLVYMLYHFHIIDIKNDFFTHPFFAIEISFTLLLLMELFSLIFVLPKSVSKSNNKQYELLSLIFLRSGFKEFSHVHHLSDWSLESEALRNMFAYSIGGLLIFVLVNWTYRLQRHVRLTADDHDQTVFIQFKKILALGLLLSFVAIGVFDVSQLMQTYHYVPSFELFYTILIFSDIMIVLYALRYSSKYIHIFRYSAFVLTTIFIRISFSLSTLGSIIVGVSGAVFVLLLTYAYNYFVQNPMEDS